MSDQIGLFDEVRAVTVRKVNGKRFISDEETLREMAFQEACEELVEAERKFAFRELFVGADRSVRSNCLYKSFRRLLLHGGKRRDSPISSLIQAPLQRLSQAASVV